MEPFLLEVPSWVLSHVLSKQLTRPGKRMLGQANRVAKNRVFSAGKSPPSCQIYLSHGLFHSVSGLYFLHCLYNALLGFDFILVIWHVKGSKNLKYFRLTVFNLVKKKINKMKNCAHFPLCMTLKFQIKMKAWKDLCSSQ